MPDHARAQVLASGPIDGSGDGERLWFSDD